MRGIKKRFFVIMFLAIFAILGCEKKPTVSVSITPRYPCNGENVTFSYSLTNLDRIEVKDARGNVLRSGTGQSGSFVISGIEQGMLPISARGWQGNESDTKEIPGDIPFHIIADTIDTESFDLQRKLLERRERTSVGTADCACVYRGTEPVVCSEHPTIYEVVDVYKGQEGDISSGLFSGRARVVKIKNDSPFTLTYSKNNSELANLPPEATKDIAFTDNATPAGTWAGIYDSDNLYQVGRGFYTESKSCGGWHSTFLDVRRDVSVKLSLRCNQ